MSDPIETRKFSDEEVRMILEKAVQRSSSKALTSSEGMSLAELKSIGAEAGIDPARIEEAARAMVVAPEPSPVGFLGGPLQQHAERTVVGEMGEGDAADLIAVIRRVMGRQGEVDEVGGALEWSAKGDSGSRYVSISTRDGKSTIRAGADLGTPAVVAYLPMGIIGTLITVLGFIGGMNAGYPFAAVLALLVLPTLFLVARTLLNRYSRNEAHRLESVVHELSGMVERAPTD